MARNSAKYTVTGLGAGLALSLAGCASGPELKKELVAIREELAAQRRSQEEQRRKADEMRLRVEQLEARVASARSAPAQKPSGEAAISHGELPALPVVKLSPKSQVITFESHPASRAPPVDTSIPMKDPTTGRAIVAARSEDRSEEQLDDEDGDKPVNLNAIVEHSPTVESQFSAAMAAYNNKDWKRASTDFKKFVDRNPSHSLVPTAMYWNGMAQQSAGKCGEAIGSWKAMLKNHPKHDLAGAAMFELAECESKLGHADKARSWLEKLVKDYPSAAEATRARTALADLKVEG